MNADDRRWRIFDEVNQELVRRDPHGPIDLPMAPSAKDAAVHGERPGEHACAQLGIVGAEDARVRTQAAVRYKCITFGHVATAALAEFVEACGDHGDTSDQARIEAIENVAVWVAIVESIDRRRVAERPARVVPRTAFDAALAALLADCPAGTQHTFDYDDEPESASIYPCGAGNGYVRLHANDCGALRLTAELPFDGNPRIRTWFLSAPTEAGLVEEPVFALDVAIREAAAFLGWNRRTEAP